MYTVLLLIILQVTRGGHYLRKSHCVLEMACEKEMASCVRGYHIYKDVRMGSRNWRSTGVFSL